MQVFREVVVFKCNSILCRSNSGNALKLWDQDMRRCKAFNLSDVVVKSVCRAKVNLSATLNALVSDMAKLVQLSDSLFSYREKGS